MIANCLCCIKIVHIYCSSNFTLSLYIDFYDGHPITVLKLYKVTVSVLQVVLELNTSVLSVYLPIYRQRISIFSQWDFLCSLLYAT